MDMMLMRKMVMAQMAQKINGITLPSNVEVGEFTPTEDLSGYTLQHSLGVAPQVAYIFQETGDWTAQSVAVQQLTLNASLSVLNSYTFSKNSQGGGWYSSGNATTDVSYSTSTEVHFGAPRYYNAKFKEGVKYFYILIHYDDSNLN